MMTSLDTVWLSFQLCVAGGQCASTSVHPVINAVLAESALFAPMEERCTMIPHGIQGRPVKQALTCYGLTVVVARSSRQQCRS